MANEYRSPYRINLEKKERKIYNEYTRLMAKGGQSSARVCSHLATKHGYASPVTIWKILQRIKKRTAAATSTGQQDVSTE